MSDLFQVGDKVGCVWDDRPHILKQHSSNRRTDAYPLVCFGLDVTLSGKAHVDDAYPSIWHWETGNPPDAGERPSKEVTDA